MRTPTPITDPELRQRIEWQMEAMKAQLDGTAGPGDFEIAEQSNLDFEFTQNAPLIQSRDGVAWPSGSWYRLKPKPKLRPFTPEEARQLVGAVAVGAVAGMETGSASITRFDGSFFYFGDDHGYTAQDLLGVDLKWKWPHEDDSSLRPFGKEGV